jgi:drug/metabolite transporter (DMT)-like permease
MAGPDAFAAGTAPAAKGYLYGVLAAMIWGSQLVMSRAGVTVGLDGFDVAAIRCGAAALAMFPWFVIQRPYGDDAGRTSWSHAFWLALAAGRAVHLRQLGRVPLCAVAAWRSPATIGDGAGIDAVIGVVPWRAVAAVAAARGGGNRAGPDPDRGPALLKGDRLTPLGDLSFMTAGLLFAIYSVLQKRWSVGPMAATGATSIVAGLIFLPAYLVFVGWERILALSSPMLIAQIMVQGLLTGFVSLVAFGRSIQILGAGRASLFPALVPVSAIILGVPVVGEWPTMGQTAGLAVVTIGLLIALLSGASRRGGQDRAARQSR